MVLLGCNLQQLVTEADCIVLIEKGSKLTANPSVVGRLLLVEESQHLIEIVALHTALQRLEHVPYDLVTEIQVLFAGRLRLTVMRKEAGDSGQGAVSFARDPIQRSRQSIPKGLTGNWMRRFFWIDFAVSP